MSYLWWSFFPNEKWSEQRVAGRNKIEECFWLNAKCQISDSGITPLKFHIAPKNSQSQKETHLLTIIFQGLCWISGVQNLPLFLGLIKLDAKMYGDFEGFPPTIVCVVWRWWNNDPLEYTLSRLNRSATERFEPPERCDRWRRRSLSPGERKGSR